MKAKYMHRWQIKPTEAKQIQLELASKVCRCNEIGNVNLVGGVDISISSTRGWARAAVVVLCHPQLELVEMKTIEQQIDFPYIPGLLSFRESPLIIAVCEKLSIEPDLILVDGQGIAHPRRLGLAAHLGLLWDKPTIGCAKSLLCGKHQPVPAEVGASSEILDHGEVIGAALRTKYGVNPIYVSTGHKIDLHNAIIWAMLCCSGYRLPEPVRLAHLAASGHELTKRHYPC